LRRLLLLGLLLIHTTLLAQSLSLESISSNIQHSLNTHLKGENRTIVSYLYSQNGNRPLWVGNANQSQMTQLIQALKNPLFNYKDKPFDQPAIQKLFFLLDNNQITRAKQAAVYARLDLLLTNSFVRLVRFVVQGDVDWGLVQQKLRGLEQSDDIKAHWEMMPKAFPPHAQLFTAIKQHHITRYLTSLLPMERRYRKLIQMLHNYRMMDRFPKVKYTHAALKLGDTAPRIANIKRRLQISGDYPKRATIDEKFDKRLRQAVINYQKRYNLKVNGMVDKIMTYYLNQPVKSNIQSILTNLDKTKLYPKHFESEYVEVNIPDFQLRYYQGGQTKLKMGVVVGRIDRPTPLFHDSIEFMVLNPTWTIPDNLIKRDLIPVLRDHPEYLEENNIHVFSGTKEITITQEKLDPYEGSSRRVPYRFVQFPGENNALGRVKFMFPNKYAVYLHDTDNKSLLSRRYKIYSSGCMRVEKPFALMQRLLQHARGSYSASKIESILQSNKPTTIKLRKHIPVHILYFTVYEEGGVAYFKNDIYLYDKIIEESAGNHKKSTFELPSNRMISVRKNGQLKKGENLRP